MSRGMSPPKLQDLGLWTDGANDGEQTDSNEVWEMEVPPKNSLPWSILLSYLFSANEGKFSSFLRKLTGNDAEIEDIKKKKKLSQDKINDDLIRQKLNSISLNKSNSTFFELAEISEILTIFDSRLKQYAYKLNGNTNELNDDLKLNAASQLLECTIDVYFPQEVENKKLVSYPKTPNNFQSNIILFEYENCQHGKRKENINLFHFALTKKQAHSLALDVQVSSSSTGTVVVGMPPPKLRDLALWTTGTNTNAKCDSNEIWEIGVPIKNSLPWSIVLSYLFSASDGKFSVFLRKLIGTDEVEDIRKKKGLSQDPISDDVIREKLKSFNPFKNRHTFFHQSKEIIEIFRIFKLRLNRSANEYELKGRTKQWNDDLKLSAASKLLECTIEVYFPEAENKKLVSYPKTGNKFQSKIILFQYENRQHGSKEETINVFHFAMTVEQANPLKLQALVHFLKKTKVPTTRITEVRDLMNNKENHGNCFLPTILKNMLHDILPEIYRSPYIALKLSEAGFQTDPMETCSEKPSALCYAVQFNADLNCIRILYDYASNCRCLFNRSVRRADDDILDTLEQIKTLLKEDISILSRSNSQKFDIKRVSDVLEQYISYSEYQHKIASDVRKLREKQNELQEFEFRKQVIEIILGHHSKYVSNKSTESMNPSDKLSNYFVSSEYYKNADNFTYACFFDNFYRLKLCMKLNNESLFLNIEWAMFLAMISNNYFLKLDHETKYRPTYDKKKYEKDHVLVHIPVQNRETVQREINTLLRKLKDASDPKVLVQSLRLSENSYALSQVKDELMIQRLRMHIDSALKVSPRDEGIKAVLVIERALQVIGESIKPPATDTSSVSYLLTSCLPENIQKALVNIRNNISHYIDHSVYGRSAAEKDLEFFDRIREQLKEMQASFKIVYFSHTLRIEEKMMSNFLKEYGNKLDEEIRKEFYEKYELLRTERKEQYEVFHKQYIQLLWKNASALLKNAKCEESKSILIGWLKSIKHLARFIFRHKNEDNLEKFAKDIDEFIVNCENKELDDFKKDLLSFLSQYVHNISLQTESNKDAHDSAIEHFFQSLHTNMFSNDEEASIREAVLNAYEEAEDARNELKVLLTNDSCPLREKSEYLAKVLIPNKEIDELGEIFAAGAIRPNSNEVTDALKKIKKVHVSKELIENIVKQYISNDHYKNKNIKINSCFKTLLTKIVYQRYLTSKIYSSVKLSDNILEKLEIFLTKNVHLLIERLKALKIILVDEDEEIKETWTWGKSEAIKYHMKFLMYQCYTRDMAVRASLDMAYFDCMNVLGRITLEIYEKSTDLFNGVNIRNLLAHNTNIEVIGGMLDKDDFPSTMIQKMLTLIDDSKAIEAMLQLFPVFGDLTEEGFKRWIENPDSQQYTREIDTVKCCKRWDEYLSLLPFAKI